MVRGWVPLLLSAFLTGDFIYRPFCGKGFPRVGNRGDPTPGGAGSCSGPYVLGVELASMLLLSGLVGAYHLGRNGSQGKG